MKALVTGGAGFIGSNFINRHAREFERVYNLDNLSYGSDLANLKPLKNYEFVKGDIRDEKLVGELVAECGIIVNFAAESHVDRSITGPKAFVESNIVGVFTLLEAARRRGVWFHQVSTDEVYGTLGMTGKFTESTAYDPRSPYSASKAAADHLVMAYHHTYGVSVTISHCSNNYGPHQAREKLIPKLITSALEGDMLPIYGNGKNVRDWIYVTDHCDGILKILKSGKPGERYNLGGDCERENIEIARTVCAVLLDLTGKDYADKIAYVDDRPGHDWRYAIDYTKMKRLGWEPKVGFNKGIRETVGWYLAHTP